MTEKHAESLPRVLPDIRICRVESMGIDKFAKCLVERPQDCKFALAFGYEFFCQHPDREKITQNRNDF
jgi:hypothetical protein